MPLYKHQREAITAWQYNHRLGIIEACTGSGKTLIGIEAIKVAMNINDKRDPIYVIVPTEALQQQWIEEIYKEINIMASTSFVVHSHIYVMIVNSCRNKVLKARLIIADEVHRFASPENYTIIKNAQTLMFLGLSATVARHDEMHLKITQQYPVVYTFPLDQAVEEGVISDFKTEKVAVPLYPDEQIKYDLFDREFKDLYSKFNNNWYLLQIKMKYFDKNALACMRACQSRNNIVQLNNSKIQAAIEIIKRDPRKTLVFCDRIEAAKKLKEAILGQLNMTSEIYHGKMSKKDRRASLDVFAKAQSGILISAKALDEGLNSPNCEIGIIMNSTSIQRQSIQRIGRIIRKVEGKEPIIYILYSKDTVDEKRVTKSLRGVSR